MSGNSPIKLLNGILILLGMMLSLVGSGFAQTNVTPEQYLALQPKPKFRPGHTLPPLTYTGWGSENSNTVVELASHWGYALDFNAPTIYLVSTPLVTLGYKEHGLAQLVRGNPNRFKAAVHTIKQFNITSYLPSAYTNLNSETGYFFSKSYYATNADGKYLDDNGNVKATPGTISSHAPAADWQRAADAQIELFKMFNSNAPISVIINDGEWGTPEYSAAWRAWHRDPRFVAEASSLGVAISTNNISQDSRINHFVAQQKGRELSHLAQAIATNFPNAFYYWYKTDMEKYRLYGRVAGTDYGTNYVNIYNFDSRFVVTNFVLPVCESYYWSANVGVTNNYAWYGVDISQTSQLLQFINWAGFMATQDRPLSYNYLSAGWNRTWLNNLIGSSYLSHGHYMGLLKCFYTMGMIGGNAGNYEESQTDFNAPFSPDKPPQWLTQKVALGKVHAQFSWLEPYLREGTLLPGPYTNLLSTDQPAYDFMSGGKWGTNLAHVFVRKLNSSDNWLLTAWTSGKTNENVTVTVPSLGEITLLARTNGAVYTATNHTPTLFDPNGLFPTESRVLPPTNLRASSLPSQ